MGDKGRIKKLTADIETLNDTIEKLKNICKELKGNDGEICDPSLRKKAASGQHGLKDNATRKQVREGLEERIDQLKRDAKKKAVDLAAELAD
jgi:predicted RNase H-like nuclease (RuvC/YqgF family)